MRESETGRRVEGWGLRGEHRVSVWEDEKVLEVGHAVTLIDLTLIVRF